MNSHLTSSGPAARRLISALLGVAVLCGLVGCTDDADQPDRSGSVIDQIKDATFAAESAAYTGQTRFADGASGPIEGVSQADPPAGEVTHPLATAEGVQDVTFLWLDGDVFIQRAVTPDSALVSATLRVETDKPWTRVDYQPLITSLYDAYDPFRLLERLALLEVVAEPQGTETVDGNELERYAVDMAGLTVSPGGARTIEFLTDTKQRLQVARLIGDDTIEYALTDFGTEVAPTPPAADQIGGSTRRPSVEPTAPFETVAQGAVNGESWQVLRAPGTDGGSCWRVDSASPLDPVAATGEGGVTCIAAFDPSGAADEQVQIVVDSGGGASFDIVVAAVGPGTTNVEMQLDDGTTHPLTIDPAGFVVWAGPKSPLAVVLEATAPNGNVAVCGPGPVTTLDDLEVMAPDQVAILDRLPWLCVEQ